MSAYRSSEPCPRCRSGATTSEGECLSCGEVWGSTFLCPHCGGHAKTVTDFVVATKCAKCGVARIARPLPREAYAPLLAQVRRYRLLLARAMVYVPASAVAVAAVSAASSLALKANALEARATFRAEHGATKGAPSSLVAELLPEPPLAFVLGLGGAGALGVVLLLSLAALFRRRVRSEARRLASSP